MNTLNLDLELIQQKLKELFDIRENLRTKINKIVNTIDSPIEIVAETPEKVMNNSFICEYVDKTEEHRQAAIKGVEKITGECYVKLLVFKKDSYCDEYVPLYRILEPEAVAQFIQRYKKA